MCDPLITRAYNFAKIAHAAVGQVRKYTGQPYIVHPVDVAMMVTGAGGDDAMIAAAYLHDVLEDTKITAEMLEMEFGNDVADLVVQVSDVSKPEDGNRAVRKEIDRAHLAKASHRAQTIKLADLISNTASIVQHDHKFAVTYLLEKQALLQVMTGGNSFLRAQAQSLLNEGLAILGLKKF